MEVRTRFAPSPTGMLHIGGLRTALYEFLWARKNRGKFVLRIEDTDQARTVEGGVENIVQTLKNFDLDFDEGPYLQSQRLDIYKKHAGELIAKQAAYYCFCTPERLEELRKQQQAQKLPPKYDKHCLKLTTEEIQKKLNAKERHVIRLNVPADQTVRFTDLIHGEIKVPTNDLDDQVLLKSDGFPTYHLAVVVDDYLMNITHVIRGEEWIPSTPKHILLYSAFGWPSPQFAHTPNILSKSGKKLSKREGEVSVQSFLDKGYLKEALINFIVLLGWNPKTEQEIFSLDELQKIFSLEHVNKSGAVFDPDKLDWFNSLYIRKLTLDELYEQIKPFAPEIEKHPKEFVLKILKLEQERLKKLAEIGERVMYFFSDPDYDASLLKWKKMTNEEIKQSLGSAKKIISNFQFPISKQEIEKKFLEEIGEGNKGNILWPLRVALTGLKASPGPFEIMDAFLVLPNGKVIILKRIDNAIKKC